MHIPILMTAAQFHDDFSLDFDGTNDEVDINTSAVSINADFTMESWVKLDAVNRDQLIISAFASGSNYWILTHRNTGGAQPGLCFQYQNPDFGTGQFVQ